MYNGKSELKGFMSISHCFREEKKKHLLEAAHCETRMLNASAVHHVSIHIV